MRRGVVSGKKSHILLEKYWLTFVRPLYSPVKEESSYE